MLEKINSVLKNVRKVLSDEKEFELENKLGIPFNPKVSQVYITLFQEKLKPLRWGAKKDTLEKSINQILIKLKSNPNFEKFNISDTTKCRILFEIVTKEYPCNIKNLTIDKMNSSNRFEPGVNGFKWKYKNITRYFMPTESYTKSIMSEEQLLLYLSSCCDISRKTNKINERIKLMLTEDIEFTFIESKAFVTYEDEALELQRGYPIPIDSSMEAIYNNTIKSIDWLVENMDEDGKFLYFYDSYTNTTIDEMHPDMTEYYNILRHSGGTITLLRGYELTKKSIYLQKAKESIDFFISTLKEELFDEKYFCYPFFNKKSKLGGAGIGLSSLMHYYIHTKDDSYDKYIIGLVRHLLSRIDNDGEMIGYYIHPKYNDGKPILNPSDELKKELFSFYYPGEALLGLALFYNNFNNIDEELKKEIINKSEKALDFLVDIRPIKYDYLFLSLPADAWLMQAIEEWVKIEGFKKQSYIDFVFNDTKQLLNRMYKNNNTFSSNKDYIGGFYYNYGDHVYHDASRCEGIISAYHLARYLNNEEKSFWIMKHIILSAKGLMKTFYDEKAVYCHYEPKKALHSFRFKLTRQWVRVDSVQHAACFLSRLLLLKS